MVKTPRGDETAVPSLAPSGTPAVLLRPAGRRVGTNSYTQLSDLLTTNALHH